MRFNWYLFIVFSMMLACNERIERSYYSNGKLYYEVPEIKGEKEGKMVMYGLDGKINRISNWSKDMLEGETILYYQNGNKKQVQYYKNGIICCVAFFYREDGSLQEKQFFNERGQKIDYEKFNSDGTRNYDFATIKAVVVAETDTVHLGMDYQCEIRLGNRRFRKIEVILGNFIGKPIEGIRLPKKDSITVLAKVPGKELGTNILQGVVLEFDDHQNDSTLVIPFKHNFYVVP